MPKFYFLTVSSTVPSSWRSTAYAVESAGEPGTTAVAAHTAAQAATPTAIRRGVNRRRTVTLALSSFVAARASQRHLSLQFA